MSQTVAAAKDAFARYRAHLYDCDGSALPAQLAKMISDDAPIRLAHPLGDVVGASGLFDAGYGPLLRAIPDLERRDYIVIGTTDRDETWLASAGFYTGVFEHPWLGIPPTRRIVTMRYIEFYQYDDGRIVKARMLWDIPALMMQARAWPMSSSLGVEFNVPGPATQDGIVMGQSDPQHSSTSKTLVDDMVQGLGRYAEGGVAAMQLEKYWHPRMNWYGPAGIGSSRRLSGFRNWHQIPFLKALPDRSSDTESGCDCYFADGDYVAYCGWPGMKMTVSGDGWMGIAPAGQKLQMASLDIWRCEDNVIRENWVLIDLLDIYRQLGIDVFARMKELTFDRQPDDFAT